MQPYFYYDEDTDKNVMRILEDLHRRRVFNHSDRIRIHLGNPETGELWLEEYDVMGYIGRSTGNKPIPLLINNRRSIGGSAILTANILSIQYTTNGQWLYRHPLFKLPEFFVHETAEKYPWCVRQKPNNNICAYFSTEQKARNYIAFMRGERFSVS